MKSGFAKYFIASMAVSLLSVSAHAIGLTDGIAQTIDNPGAGDYVAAGGLALSSAPTVLTMSSSDPEWGKGAITGKNRRIFREASPEAAKAILNLSQGLPVYTNVNSGLLFHAAGLCGQQKKIKEFKNDASALACIIEMNARLNR